MKRLIITASVAGLSLIPLAAAHADTLPGNVAGNNCTTTQATGNCSFQAPSTAQHATGYISEGTGTITSPPKVVNGVTTYPCAITPAASPVPTVPGAPTTPSSNTIDPTTGDVTITGPGAGSLTYVPGCTYTVTASTGVIEGGTVS